MTNDTNSTSRPGSGSWLRRGAIAAALLGGGVFLGAAGFATAQGAMGPGLWHGGHHGPKLGMVQFFVRGALENVGATSDQETKVHDIIATAYQKVEPGEDHDAMRKQVLDILRAPTVDRAAAESLRAKKIADMDAKSKLIVGAALDAAAQLTPEQRVKLSQNVETHMAEHAGWHRWGGPDGGTEHGPMDHHGPDADQH